MRSKVNFSAITHPNDWALAKLFLVMLRENKLNVEARLQYTLLFFFYGDKGEDLMSVCCDNQPD